jgi:uncharacterized Tic20 family protein
MEDRPLNSSIRRKAARCHLAGLIWLPISIVIFLLLPMVYENSQLFIVAIFLFPLIGMIFAALLTILLWKADMSIDPFLDRSGRSAINFVLSCALYLAIVCTLLVTTCGYPFLSPVPFVSREIDSIAEVLGGLLPLLGAWHVCTIISRSFSAWMGTVPSNSLMIKFLAEAP